MIGVTTDAIGDQYFIPGWGKMGGSYVQILGAETLRSGTPTHVGWIPAYLMALGLAAWAIYRKNSVRQTVILVTAAVALLLGPTLLEANLIFVDVTPGLFVVAWVGSVLAWRRFRVSGLVNESGLANLNALRANRSGRKQALIVARILNYAEIVATLPSDNERQLVEQIVARLSVGSSDRTFYQGDGGIFAWFEEPRLPFGNHIDALYSLFRTPIGSGRCRSTSRSASCRIGSSRSLANRLAARWSRRGRGP